MKEKKEFQGKLLSYKDSEYLTDMIRFFYPTRSSSRTLIINHKRRTRNEIRDNLCIIRDRGFIWDDELNFVNNCKEYFLKTAFKGMTDTFVYKPFWWDSKGRYIDDHIHKWSPWASLDPDDKKEVKYIKVS
jgi:hypothetical protein